MENKKNDQGILTAISLCKDTPDDFKTTTVDYWQAKAIFFAESDELHVGQIMNSPQNGRLEIIDIYIKIFDNINTNEYGFDPSWTGAILPNNFLVRVVIKQLDKI